MSHAETPRYERAHELIARVLTETGLDARPEDGWVNVYLPDGRVLWIGAEYGQSLDAEVTEVTFRV